MKWAETRLINFDLGFVYWWLFKKISASLHEIETSFLQHRQGPTEKSSCRGPEKGGCWGRPHAQKAKKTAESHRGLWRNEAGGGGDSEVTQVVEHPPSKH
jgi:hypothetical protein